MIDTLASKHVMLISDSCFSGDILKSTRSSIGKIDNEYFKKSYAKKSRQALTSGSLETVPDKSEFAAQLKRILKYNNKPYIDPMLIYVDLRDTISKTLPLYGSLVGTAHEDGGNYLLFLKEQFAKEQMSKEDKNYFISIYNEQLAGIVTDGNDLNLLGTKYQEVKNIFTKANLKGITEIVNQSMQKMSDIERAFNALITAEMSKADVLLTANGFDEGTVKLQQLAQVASLYEFELIGAKVNDAITTASNRKKDFITVVKGEYEDITQVRYESREEFEKAQAAFTSINEKVALTKSVLEGVDPVREKTAKYLDATRGILDIQDKRVNAKPVRTGMITAGSVLMVLGAASGGMIGGFYAINDYYRGQYVTAENDYKNGSISWSEFSTSRTTLGSNMNTYGSLFIAMIPVSAVLVITSAILYSAAPYEARFERDLKKFENMLAVTAGINGQSFSFVVSKSF